MSGSTGQLAAVFSAPHHPPPPYAWLEPLFISAFSKVFIISNLPQHIRTIFSWMTYGQQSQEQRSRCTPGRRFKPSVISPLATPLCVLTQNKPQRSDLVQPAGLTLVRDSVSSASRVQIEYPHLRLSTPTQTVQFS